VSTSHEPLRIGTRGSALALAQTDIVRVALQTRYPDLPIEVVRITTKGDLILDRPLAKVGDKGLFVAEIEEALHSGRIDCAVHSAKDLPSTLSPGMGIIAFLERADPRDVLVTRSEASSIDTLPKGARVGTGSPRRVCQLRANRPDLTLLDIRGNVDTRLRKMVAGEYDALILAAAGLDRLGVHEFHVTRLDPHVMLPAVGQGAIAIEVSENNARAQELVAPLNHTATSIAVRVEREFLAAVGGGCHAAMGAHAKVDGTQVHLSGMIGSVDGRLVRGTQVAEIDPDLSIALKAARDLVTQLMEQGGRALHESQAADSTVLS
jgi:hydroxymethylbilane synthase